MQLRRNVRPTFLFIPSILLVTILLLFQLNVFAANGKDYVIVIDVSTSMQDIFDEVKRLTNRTLGEAKAGDNVALIIFGENARLLDRRLIRGKADIEELQRQVDALYPTDYATYLNSGLEKSISELRYLFEKYPDRERVLLWLSDDKDNPPAALGQDYLSLDRLREKNEQFEPGREWFAYQAPLSEVKNESFEDFVTWARRTTFRIGVRESDINLGSFHDDNVRKKIVLTFEPIHPGAAGLEFFTEATMIDPTNPARTIPVTLSPNRIVASAQVWQQEFDVSFAGAPGVYNGQVVFKSLAGPILDVKPQRVALTAMIVPPAPVEVPGPKPEEKKLEEVVARAKESATGRPAGMTRPERPLTFGPLEPGKKDTKMITLHLNKEADSKKISQDVSIQLPKGFNVESKIYGTRDTTLAAEITISVAQETVLPEEMLPQGAYEGSMRFVSNEADIEILPLVIPIRIEMNTDRVRWGRKLLPTTAGIDRSRARKMTFEELTQELEGREGKEENRIVSALRSISSRFGSRYVLIPFFGGVIILFIILLYRMKPAQELFVGELVVIKDPTNSKTKNINLKRIGSLHGKDTLIAGSSPNADIRLDHESVAATHFKLSARKIENQVEVSILPVKGVSLKVNDVECTGRTRLADKDLLGIGEYILLFSNPESQKEVVVHFTDGRTMRGTPVTWDIGAPSFELLRTDVEGVEETAEEIANIHFETLKGVFFLQDASGASGIPKDRIQHHELLEVTFFDGEKIEGNPLVDYSNLAARFYLVPKDMPNIVSILIERSSVKDLVSREAKGGSESPGRFASLKGRRKQASAD
ncbi:MAG: VWA domain-containing protein [Candidatus Abyssobacteria bacterium SURF_5]|uniref:VWA domain-containing protein n=1 Tax=Abyssobacteria bacterium (strain SURF_5) TaxID=2093360 RepID=A0A3A4NJX7_ABYX5|nr:MAG: VWA domain-containing protein [Candidatus Abyssubacteria bacterium SURF_5]